MLERGSLLEWPPAPTLRPTLLHLARLLLQNGLKSPSSPCGYSINDSNKLWSPTISAGVIFSFVITFGYPIWAHALYPVTVRKHEEFSVI